MAFTQADLDKLNAAIASGSVLQSISFADQSFTFRSMADMLQLRAVMQKDITKVTSRLAATSKGA